jgi:hypothetical protein
MGGVPMASKKHPLEVFKQHGAMPSLKSREKKSRQRKGLPLFQRAESVKEKAKADEPAQRRQKAPRVAPGDRKISLTLNNLLIAALVVVAVSLATYFWGYSRGKHLGGEESVPKLQERQTQLFEKERVTKSGPAGSSMMYGVQVCTWDASKESTAQEAQAWLQKKGFKSKLYFEKTRGYVIFVGSFSDAEDPELKRLLGTLRSINDYPYGTSSPFKSAMIRPFVVNGG